MSKPSRPVYTWGEICAQLRKSASSVPSLFVEGPEDVRIIQQILLRKGMRPDQYLRLYYRGGRNVLLQDYRHRQHLPRALRYAFWADRDLYVFTGLPPEYAEGESLYFTEGYSIENDLFCDGEQRMLELLLPDARARFDAFISAITEWYAFAIAEALAGKSVKLDISLRNSDVFSPSQRQFTPHFLQNAGFAPVLTEKLEAIRSAYRLRLRGKLIWEAYQLAAQQQEHNEGLGRNLSEEALSDICIIEGLKPGAISRYCHRIISLTQALRA